MNSHNDNGKPLNVIKERLHVFFPSEYLMAGLQSSKIYRRRPDIVYIDGRITLTIRAPPSRIPE